MRGEMASGGLGRSRARSALPRGTWTQLLLLLGGIAIVLPFIFVVVTSLKLDSEWFRAPTTWIPEFPSLSNYVEVITRPEIQHWAWNTVSVVVVSLVGELVSCTVVAYALARLRFRGRDALFGIVVATLMLPAQVLLIPQYVLFNALGWVDTLYPLTVPSYFALNAFFVFFLRQYFRSIPKELEEAMLVDGAGRFMILRKLIVPLSGPAFAVVAVIHIVATYNDYFTPLIYLHSADNLTLAVGMATVNQIIPGIRSIPKEMAGAVIFVLPLIVIYLVLHRRVTEAVEAGAGIRG
jgi:multiple sugar transport system permease protein/sn-glycerol 3-phosphate transport system permease protein